MQLLIKHISLKFHFFKHYKSKKPGNITSLYGITENSFIGSPISCALRVILWIYKIVCVFCLQKGNAALLLANLEKEKELLRIFLRVSQMENAVLRRMNLNSFLMVSNYRQ